jgi:nucleoside-diphosphate kinase
MGIEQTLILIKPDGVQRGLIGEIIKRFEQRGLKIVGIKMTSPDKSQAGEHYAESISKKHGKHVRDYLIDYITSAPIIAIAIQGIDAIKIVRKIVGSTYPGDADIGTIRGDFAHATKEYVRENNQGQNLIHASENEEDAKKELALWFSVDEIHDYSRAEDKHLI